MSLPSRSIGDRDVSCLGLGCMPLSPSSARPVIHEALDSGVTLLDTANIYAPAWDQVGANEHLVSDALRAWGASAADRDRVLVTTKGGITRSAGEVWGRDASAGGLRRAAEASLTALGVDVIELYQLHRLDPALSVLAQVESLATIQQAGLARMVGLSNVTLQELEVAIEVLGPPDSATGAGIVSVQNEFSPRFRADADVPVRCEELGIAFLPWSPLGGAGQAGEVGSRYAAFAEVAARHGVSPQRVALAWHLARSDVTIPIPGSTRSQTLQDSLAAAVLVLDGEELAALEASEPAGDSVFPDDIPRPPLRP